MGGDERDFEDMVGRGGAGGGGGGDDGGSRRRRDGGIGHLVAGDFADDDDDGAKGVASSTILDGRMQRSGSREEIRVSISLDEVARC